MNNPTIDIIKETAKPHDQGRAGRALGVRRLKACAPMAAADEEAVRCQVYGRTISWRCGRYWPLTPLTCGDFEPKPQLVN